jgi:DNA-binding NarL/FixJ family response regulator
MSPTRITIVADDPFFSSGIRRLLAQDASLLINDSELHTLSGKGLYASELLVVDSRLPGVLEGCAQLSTNQRPYVVLLMVDSDALAVDGLIAGARGIVRTDRITDVVQAIRVVNQGSLWAPRQALIDLWLQTRRGEAPSGEQCLSARELEVVRSVASGMSNKELAEHLGISTATVKTHLTRVFQKLGMNGRGQLIAAYHGGSLLRMRLMVGRYRQALTDGREVVFQGPRAPRSSH